MHTIYVKKSYKYYKWNKKKENFFIFLPGKKNEKTPIKNYYG